MLQFFWRHMRRDERGFTLIELLIVVAIIAILAAILIPNFLRARKQAQISATKGNLKNIGTALESYFVDNDNYPEAADWDGDLQTGDYIRAVPQTPVRTDYDYEVSGDNQDYTLCDSDTDVVGGTTTTWYYSPGAGLKSINGATCPDPG